MFVDIHNHLLPGVDDGARTMDETLRMAREAFEGGTDTMAATPHRSWQSRRDAPASWIADQVAAVRAALRDAGIPLSVLPGVELQIVPGLAAELTAGTLSPLGSGRWYLIEPSFSHIPKDAFGHLRDVQDAGFSIVLAHPERSADIQRDLGFAEACADAGMVLQLTTGSILGTFGRRPQDTALAILARAGEWPLVIASDMHDLQERSPAMMRAARDAAAAVVGIAAADAMVDARPRAIVTGQSLPPL